MDVRTLLFVGIGLGFLSSLAAQSDVPGDQCLGGTLLAIQPDSVTLKFNEKIITTRLAPDAEIWRRGVDLENAGQLVVGDDISLRCTRDADGAVLASMVAAAEKDDGIRMEPHHIAEIRVCGGRLLAIAKDTLSAKNENGICVMRVNANTEIWRGENLPDTSGLKVGDDVVARAVVGYPSGELTAELVEANVAKTEGTIVAASSDRIVVKECHDNGVDRHPCVRTTVLFYAGTHFDLSDGRLRKGATVMAIGLDVGRDTMRASTVTVEK